MRESLVQRGTYSVTLNYVGRQYSRSTAGNPSNFPRRSSEGKTGEVAHAAFSHSPAACGAEHSNGCVGLWALSRWDEERGARRLALAGQPIHVRAVGPEGQMVIEGRILDGAPADIEQPWEAAWQALLLGPRGNLIAEIERGTSLQGGLGGTHFALIHRERREDGVRTEELVAVDWVTGEETILVTGLFIRDWVLDHSDRRVTALVTPMEGVGHELWSGVVSL